MKHKGSDKKFTELNKHIRNCQKGLLQLCWKENCTARNRNKSKHVDILNLYYRCSQRNDSQGGNNFLYFSFCFQLRIQCNFITGYLCNFASLNEFRLSENIARIVNAFYRNNTFLKMEK